MNLTPIFVTLTLCSLAVACGGPSSADQLFEGQRASAGKAGSANSAGGGGRGGAAGSPVGGASGTSGAGGGVSGGGGKAGAPAIDCSGKSGNSCRSCCEDHTGGVVTQAFVLACGCAVGVECGKPCGTNLCGGKQPSMQCAGCLNAVGDDDPCVKTFHEACAEDPACSAGLSCLQACE